MKTIKTVLFTATLCAMISLLTACGFHLRKQAIFSEQIKILYITTAQPNSPFIQTLKRELLANNFKLVSQQEQATAILEIISINESNELSSLMGGGSAGQYTVSTDVTFKVDSTKGKSLLPSNTVSQSSLYSSNATQILSSDSQEKDLIAQMQQSLANKIIKQLETIPTTSSTTADTADKTDDKSDDGSSNTINDGTTEATTTPSTSGTDNED